MRQPEGSIGPAWGQPPDLESDQVLPTMSALQIRNIRDQVRFTSSLLSSFRPVREEMSILWACDFVRRVIYWRPFAPIPPFRELTPKELLFLMTHEAGHLNFTSGWETPKNWSKQKQKCFSTFVNAVEDIRIERLMGREFPGFESFRKEVNRTFMEWNRAPHSLFLAVWDQVGLNWIEMENEDNDKKRGRIGHPNCVKFAEDLWPDITRVANARNTNELAQALIPIFERLYKEQENESRNDPNGTGSGYGSGMSGDEAEQFRGCGSGFGDEPHPDPNIEKTELNDTLSKEEQLKEMSKSAGGEGKRKLKEVAYGEQQKQGQAQNTKAKVEASNTGEGIPPGTRPDPRLKVPKHYWRDSKSRMDPQIRALGHRLRAVLKTNSANNWAEGLRRGQLNTRRAQKAVGGNNRIFRKRREIGAHDYTFGIVNDCSGSMHTTHVRDGDGVSKRVCRLVLDMTVLLAESFEKANLDYFIVNHDTQMRSAKGIRQNLKRECEIVATDIAESGGGTYEAPALIVAQEEFRKVRSGHKVMFILSDGHTDGIAESQQLVRELQMEGVRVIGVGLRINPPAHHPNGIKVMDVAQLPAILPRMINDIVRKGAQ